MNFETKSTIENNPYFIVNTKSGRALFIVDNTAQVEMVAPVIMELPNLDILAINVDKWYYKSEIEESLSRLKIPYITVEHCNKKSINKLLIREKPAIVIVCNDEASIVRLFVDSANFMGIPTLLIQDGILSRKIGKDEFKRSTNAQMIFKYFFALPSVIFNFVLRNKLSWHNKIEIVIFELRYRPKWAKKGTGMYPGTGNCTKMAVFSDITKEMFIVEGIDSERIVVTGNPKFDKIYYSKNTSTKEMFCQKYGIPSDKHVIVLLTQFWVEAKLWSIAERKQFVLAIVNAVIGLPNTQLIVKLHPPHENEHDYLEIVKGLPSRPIILKYTSLPELLNACSLAITVSSTAALEAMALGKPVIIVDLFNQSGNSFFNGSGALFARIEQEILPAMRRALYDEQTKDEMAKSIENFVFKQAYLQDGQASKRIADLIMSMGKR